MSWPFQDPYRWRKRFALLPKRVGDRFIWLVPYAWRDLTPEETPPKDPAEASMYSDWAEYILKDGYRVRCKTLTFSGTLVRSWHEVPPE